MDQNFPVKRVQDGETRRHTKEIHFLLPSPFPDYPHHQQPYFLSRILLCAVTREYPTERRIYFRINVPRDQTFTKPREAQAVLPWALDCKEAGVADFSLPNNTLPWDKTTQHRPYVNNGWFPCF